MDPSTYGERIADVYDEWYEDATDVDGTVAMVRELTGGRPVLELGIGTGRLAVPMLDAGLEVHGIDASPAMVAKLRAKVGDRIPVTVADFAEMPERGPSGKHDTFGVILLAFNALLNLTDENDQLRCLRWCAALGDRVIVETFVPGDAAPSSAVDVRHVDAEEVRLSAYLIVDNIVTGSIVSITEAGIRLRPWSVRMSPPARLDHLAVGAGLELEARWSGWRRQPFDDTCDRAVTVYRSVPR